MGTTRHGRELDSVALTTLLFPDSFGSCSYVASKLRKSVRKQGFD